MRILVILSAFALAAGCTRIDERTEGRAAAASERACEAVAVRSWRPLSGAEFTVEGISSGPDCARAVATLAVRDVQGNVLWAEATPSEHIMVLADARDEAAMRAALGEWADASNNTTMQTSAALPDWPARADGPVSGEFPFYAEPHFDRDSYLELRESNVPLFCYVQGMESMACLALRNGGFEKVGVQTFPG